MSRTTVFLLILLTISIVWGLIWGGKLPMPFRARTCQGRDWRRAFPGASKRDIRQFLDTFVDAFAFHRTERLKLNPNDQIMDVYRAIYPHKWQADAMEMETLEQSMESVYGFSLRDFWHDGLTLGELFAQARATA